MEFSFRLLGVLAIVPFVILGMAIYVMESTYQNIQERELGEISDLMMIQKEKISSDFRFLSNAIQAYSSLSEWKELESTDKIEINSGGIPESDESLKRQAARLLISDYGFQSFGITLIDGRMYFLEPFEHQSNLSKMNFSDREWFQGVLQIKDTYVSNVFISDASGHPIIVISTPIFSENGEIMGMWGGSLDIEYLTEFLDSVKTKNSSMILIDENMITIANTKDLDSHEEVKDEQIVNIINNWSDSSTYEKNDGKYYFVSDIEIGTKRWKLITSISENDLTPQLSSNRNSNYLLIVLMGVFISISEYLLFIFLRRNFQLNFDIRENRKMLVKQERLAAIGELASRVSHDIRNPLSNIRMSLKLLENGRKSRISEEELKEKLQIIDKNVGRIEHQIENVLEYVKNKQTVRSHISLSSCLDESIKLLHIPDNIKINSEKTKIEAFVDPIQIQVVCNNILINAIQAIGKEKGEIKITFHEDKEFNIIQIENSGPPISEEILPNIFEPLVTTKEIGTGLGLASCKRIIENHGGTINVKNNPTTFTIRLPKS